MRTTRLFVAAILAATGLVAAGTTEAANAASSKDLTVSYSGKVIKNETFTLSGRLSTHTERTVKLQYRSKNSGSWSTKSSTTSNSGGYFSFSQTLTKSRYFRYYAPAGGGLSKVTGNSKKVSVVSQKVSIFEISDASQCHFLGNSSNFNTMTVFTKFYPARPGREVKVVTEKYGTFTGSQDSSGIESFQVFPGNVKQNSTFQARTSAANGAATKYSSTKTSSLTTCFFVILDPLKK